MCIQLCTRGYTIVYTRVYSPLIGSRYTLGISAASTQIVLSSLYAHRLLCPRSIVFSCVGPDGGGAKGRGKDDAKNTKRGYPTLWDSLSIVGVATWGSESLLRLH